MKTLGQAGPAAAARRRSWAPTRMKSNACCVSSAMSASGTRSRDCRPLPPARRPGRLPVHTSLRRARQAPRRRRQWLGVLRHRQQGAGGRRRQGPRPSQAGERGVCHHPPRRAGRAYPYESRGGSHCPYHRRPRDGSGHDRHGAVMRTYDRLRGSIALDAAVRSLKRSSP